ncbi:MAG: hypothetical protein FWF29_06800 [Treponema sp.]|nr:hypothetical protein [Treponema sp.]
MESTNKTPGNFFASLKNRMGVGSPERNATDTYERGMQIVPGCISANDNEIPVRQYNIAVLRNLLKFERAEGRMQVTNKRVIFRAAGRSVGGRTTLQHEFAIDEIAGIEARKNFKFSFLHLIFALIIIIAANLIINGAAPNFSNYGYPGFLYQNRITRMMMPSHVIRARSNERAASAQRAQSESNLPKATANVKTAKAAEEKAANDAQNGILKSRRVVSGRTYWGETMYRTESYRDKSADSMKIAQEKLGLATADRIKAEEAEQDAIDRITIDKKIEDKAIKDRVLTEKVWKVSMTVLGLILGFGGWVPFFMLYKKFGLKLLILNFSIFGFALSLGASGFSIWTLFIVLSVLIAIVCIFLYCFRPNLVISIKNRGGIESSVDIRRDTLFSRRREKGTGFSEIIPTDETESAIREIGAMIGDIQKLGDLGLDKWIYGDTV